MTLDASTTGQTIGITRIPLKTLQRYIRDFREYFSPAAQLRTKGRKFTVQDVENLLLIRRLCFEHVGPDRIRAALRGEWTPPAKPVYDTFDALNLVDTARQEKELSEKYYKKSYQAAWEAERIVDGAEHTLKRFHEIIAQRDYFRDQVPFLLSRIKELEDKVYKLEEKSKYFEPKKRGLIESFFG